MKSLPPLSRLAASVCLTAIGAPIASPRSTDDRNHTSRSVRVDLRWTKHGAVTGAGRWAVLRNPSDFCVSVRTQSHRRPACIRAQRAKTDAPNRACRGRNHVVMASSCSTQTAGRSSHTAPKAFGGAPSTLGPPPYSQSGCDAFGRLTTKCDIPARGSNRDASSFPGCTRKPHLRM